jgi:enamine deaminase RidA (YjgF/YER057c/UK114 family)
MSAENMSSENMSAEKRIRELKLDLPAPPAPGGNYLSAKQVGNVLYLAGVVSTDPSGVLTGTVGRDCTIEDAYAAARRCALTQLAVLRRELGSLDRVAAVISVNGYVNCTDGFADSPTVINGFSDLMIEVFGDRGRHVRCAVGVNALPRNARVEVHMAVLLAES